VNDVLGPDDEPDDVNDVDWMAASESSSSRKTKKRKNDRSNGSPRTSKALVSRSKNTNNSPRTSHPADPKDLLDPNANMHSVPARHPSDATRGEKIHDAAALWHQHISATLAAGQDAARGSATPQDLISGGSSSVAKKQKKSAKHGQSKKSKKRQMNPQPSAPL